MANIAIVGTGISGLGAAFLLQPQHQLTLYEQSSDIGGHTRTRMVRYGDKSIPVDTGFIVFNYPNYPYLGALFKWLDVPVQKSDMTFAVTIDGGTLEWGAKNLNAVFGQRSNLLNVRFWKMIGDVLRFMRSAEHAVEREPQLTLGQLMHRLRCGDWFARYYILPMGGAIWSCPLRTMLSFPAKNFVQFFKNHGLLSLTGQPQWHTVTGGSKEYVTRLIAPFANHIRTNCAVTRVVRENGKVHITDSRGESHTYDHVVLASHADQSLALLDDASNEERAALAAFKYQKNRAILHKDISMMPKRKRCWASWVYHANAHQGESDDAISVTYWMNLLQSIPAAYPLFVTLNPAKLIPREHIFDEHVFEHPIYSLDAVAAQSTLQALQGQRNTWFCGAYMRNGFHEDGLASAVAVAEKLGATVPWR